MWFHFGRKEGFPTQYAPYQSPVTVDVIEVGFIAAFIIIALSFLVALPTNRLKTNLYTFVRVSTLLVIGLLVLLGNFGQSWEVGSIVTRTPYKAASAAEINASLGLFLGLRGVNITLKGLNQPEEIRNEVIDYNEHFSWTWDQGRFGFGPFAGPLRQAFRLAQQRGLPLPILWIVEHLIVDGEGFRSGRFYRTAGWYCHICMYCAFTCWILALVLLKSVLRYGAYWLALCGLFQLAANLLWLCIRNPGVPLAVRFEDAVITTSFGPTYWITFVCGLFCVLSAIAIVSMENRCDLELYEFFEVDPLNKYSEVAYLTKKEELLLRKETKESSKPANNRDLLQDIAMTIRNKRDANLRADPEDDVEYVKIYRPRQFGTSRKSIKRNAKSIRQYIMKF